jgi:hypothetical protein
MVSPNLAAERVAAAHHAEQQALARAAAIAAARSWSAVDPDNIARSWATLLDRTLADVTVAQYQAAAGADGYLAASLDSLDATAPAVGRVVPGRLAGIASDGRPLSGLLFQPAVQSLHAVGAGATTADALRIGRISLDMIVRSQVADAGRVAVGVGITARPRVGGYVRMLSGKSCSRCVVLAGKFYRWNQGFQRHPRCDCRHFPAGDNIPGSRTTNPRAAFDGMSRAEQDRTFTRAGADAIRDGADLGRVVNARRGMSTTGEFRTRVNADGQVVNERHRTRTGMLTSSAAQGGRRLMPEAIYVQAGGDREEALRLLRQYGYII